VHVPDPYQWLEENSDEVDNWTTAQAAFTQAYLDQKADTKRLKDKFRAGMDYAKVITRPLSCISSSCLKPFPVVLCANSTFFFLSPRLLSFVGNHMVTVADQGCGLFSIFDF
jgi:hypothetical protein